MNVLIIGSGAREHALAWAVAKSERVNKVFVAPGNGGTALIGGKVCNLPLKATALEGLLEFAQSNHVDLTVVGSEHPLELGIVDLFRSAGKQVVGPTQAAARLESSKVFSKEFMRRQGIPTAGYHVFGDLNAALPKIRSSNNSLIAFRASSLLRAINTPFPAHRPLALIT